MLAPRLARFVSRTVQSRGERYHASGRVEILAADAREVHAIVTGTREYQVSLAREAGEILGACSCPYFGDRVILCKHVWATLLAADSRGALALPGDTNRTELRFEAIPAQDAGLETDYPDVEDLDLDQEFDRPGYALRAWQPAPRRPRQPPRPDRWTEFTRRLDAEQSEPSWRGALPQELLYIVSAGSTKQAYALVMEIAGRDRKANGAWGRPHAAKLSASDLQRLKDPLDRRILARLYGADAFYTYAGAQHDGRAWMVPPRPSTIQLRPAQIDELLPMMADAGRSWIRRIEAAGVETLAELRWDDGPAWRFTLEIDETAKGGFHVDGSFRRDDHAVPVRDESVIVAEGVLILDNVAARFDEAGARAWIHELRQRGAIEVPAKAATSLVESVWRTGLEVHAWPDALRYTESEAVPLPQLIVSRGGSQVQGRLLAELTFIYGDMSIGESEPALVVDHERRTVIRRDAGAEAARRAQLIAAGFRVSPSQHVRGGRYEIADARLGAGISPLIRDGWRVEAEGRLHRTAGRVEMHVTSGIDWFELSGAVTFDDTEVGLPELLAAVRRGRTFIELGDGSIGMLPEEWLQKYGSLAALAAPDGDHVRFSRGQVGLLDALLAEQPAVSWDEGFARARETFSRFAGIAAADPPPTFTGELREYQREGLGWLQFLREAGFGGCLADDMGLGKTIMVLALLERLRLDAAASSSRLPSLVVVPRSLVFNWLREAARFTPDLRIADYTGAGRAALDERLTHHDVVLTTYGTLRRDVARLKDVRFEYVVLDESQAIKNANTASAKATRLLQAHHRLALSGTPIENHLGELWSLFEFLNPGLLGAASLFKTIGPGAARQDPEALKLVGRGLKPFILRRTKEQVAADLPPKVEQTIYCELDPPQRKVYDELKRHYQRTLLARVSRDGLAKSKMHILEALLRLRQAACHPALIDRARAGDPSAKLEVLLSRLDESREEGHKTLVFSQFTSFLALVQDRLRRSAVAYEYLDGQTRDRAARVDRFQRDPGCRLFLISLKAGGLGLNLTAAEHVFLLDPWWNPAVEAQAIDRAHRIGQSQRVFAFRLIARDTVEERVLELQNTKRALADAILGEGADLVRTLKREDLELLLS